jgi:hypothetical protein
VRNDQPALTPCILGVSFTTPVLASMSARSVKQPWNVAADARAERLLTFTRLAVIPGQMPSQSVHEVDRDDLSLIKSS